MLGDLLPVSLYYLSSSWIWSIEVNKELQNEINGKEQFPEPILDAK